MRSERFLEALGEIDEKYIEEARYNTMKKKFNFKPIVAIAACAAIAFAAVPVVNNFVNATPAVQGTEEVGFTVYESGLHGGAIIGTHEIEIELNKSRESYIEKDRIGTFETVNIQGISWTAEYECTKSETDYAETLRAYTGVSNGKNVTFMINAVTGECEVFGFNNLKDASDAKLTRDELYEIAYKNLMEGEYTDDPENYVLSNEADNGLLGYTFKFSRFVDGIETAECACITIKHSGEFYFYLGYHIDEMKHIDVSDIDMDKLYNAIESKLKNIYKDAYVGFKKSGAVYTKLTNGKFIFDCTICVDVKSTDGRIVKDYCYFVVMIDK